VKECKRFKNYGSKSRKPCRWKGVPEKWNENNDPTLLRPKEIGSVLAMQE